MVKKVLFVTLSNFGDVVLSLPVLDSLRENYPDALITVMVGPRAAEIFKGSPDIQSLIIYDKYAPLRERIQLFFKLYKEHFDIVIDLRNSLFGALLRTRYRTSPFLYVPSNIRHMKERNLFRLRMALKKGRKLLSANRRFFKIRQEDKDYINNLLDNYGITKQAQIIIISPATGGSSRRWQQDRFIQLSGMLAKRYTVILIGRKIDRAMTEYIKTRCTEKIFDFAGLTDVNQLAFLLSRSALVVVGDTGVLQLASYLDVPIVGLFGPSDEQRYGPWSSRFKVVSRQIMCRPCRKPSCRFGTLECMREISPEMVLDSIDAVLKS